MFENKKLIIFDFDGTLVDSMDYWSELDKTLIKRLSGKEIDVNFQELWEMKMKQYSNSENPILEYCAFLKAEYSLEGEPCEILLVRDEIARDFYRKDIRAKKGAKEFVKRLKDDGKILVIATTTGRENINEAMKNENISDMLECFSAIFTYEDVLKQKPDAEVHFKIMEKFKVGKDECIIFEDSLSGVLAANNAGIEVISVRDNQSVKNIDEIKKRSLEYIEDFDMLK